MTIPSYIQSYVPVASLGGDTTMSSTIAPQFDWVHDKAIGDSANSQGVRVFTISTGVEYPTSTISAITSAAQSGWDSLCGIDRDGNFYFGAESNFAALKKVNINNLTLIYSVGFGSVVGPPTTEGIAGQAIMSIGARADWIVSTSQDSNQGIQVNSASDGHYITGNGVGANGYAGSTGRPWTVHNTTQICMSPGVAARGSAHGFVTDGNGPYIYHVGVDDSSSTVNPDCRFDLVTADPAALVDPLWPGAIVGATAVDQSDNGLISFVSVDDSFFAANYDAGTTYAAGDPVRANPVVGGQFSFYVSLVNGNIGNTPASSPTDWGLIQKQYLVKFNTGPFSVSGVGTFGLAWKVPISIMANQGNLQGYSRISNKLFGYLVCDSGVTTAYVYRTGDGSLWVSAVIPGVTVFANPSFNLQCFDDVTQSFVFQGTYDSTVTGAPAPLNATVTTGGAWMRLILAFTPPPPPPAPPPGGGYIIERFDNRIWPTVENAWCVDCGFTLPRPTPASDLTMDSATGAGILTGVTDLVGGSGYSASTTAQVIDGNGLGPGTGAIPILTIVGGVITAIAFAPAGSGYVYPNLVFNDPENTGSGASAKVTLDNSCMCTASDPIFVLDDVGSVIRLGYGVAPITSFVDSTHVIVNMLSPTVFLQPDDPIPPNTQTQLAGTWTMTKPISSFYLPQLIGFEITGLADGQIIPPVVVPANGIVTLAQPASAIIVGLGFQAQLQSTYLDAGEPTVQGQRKKIAEVTVRVEQSASFQAGGNQPDGSVQSPQQLAPPWQNMIDVPNPAVPPFNSPAQQLFTGDIRVPIPSGYNTRGQVAVQQSNPLPLQVLDYVPEVLAGDKASQEAPKREQPQNGRKGR